jgi:flavin-dependent dehydrogenase
MELCRAVDPLTFEGLYFSYKSAKLLATALKSGENSPTLVTKQYMKALNAAIISEIRFGRILSQLTYQREAVRRFIFRRYGKQLTKLVTEVFEGKRSYKSELLKPTNYFSYF